MKTQTMRVQNERRTMRRNRQWMRNPAQLKNPKVFSMKAVRNPDGSFHLLGGETLVLNRKNQYDGIWTRVDTRDFVRELKTSRITCR